MKHIALAWTFAVALAAQQGQGRAAQDPKTELAAVIAVEEQERDLGKAEKLYREALAGTKLSEEGRRLANERFGRMLQKLGRAEEAKPFLAAAKPGEVIGFDDFGPAPSPQDVEREKALREKARGIVQQILKQESSNWEPPLHGIASRELAEQLLWIGEAAVPEVIAALQAEQADLANGTWSAPRGLAVQGLAGFLWRTGGTLSSAYLASCAKVPEVAFRAAIVATAFQAEQPAMLAEAARFLDDPAPDDVVASALLRSTARSGNPPPLNRRFDPARIVDAALRGPARGKVRMLGWAQQAGPFDAATLGKLHGLVREGLKSTDPELGNAAVAFLLSQPSQGSIDGIELLLQELPTMRDPNAQPGSLPPVNLAVGATTRFSAGEAARLLPAIDVCVRTLSAAGAWNRGKNWLTGLMLEVANALDASVVPQVLAWMDLGYDVWGGFSERITAANSKEVFARFDRIRENERAYFLDRFAALELPGDMFPLLRDKADQLGLVATRQGANLPVRVTGGNEDRLLRTFARAMAKTGDPKAADWIMAKGSPDNWIAQALVELGRRTREENVRAAMREVAGFATVHANHRVELLLALLAMHDEPVLELVVKLHGAPGRANHPYAAKAEFLLSPLQYLLYENPDPPHGFTEDQVIAVLEKIWSDPSKKPGSGLNPRECSVDAIPDRILGVLARIDYGTGYDGVSSWCKVAVTRLRTRQGEGPLAAWFDEVLAKGGYLGDVLQELDRDQIERYRPRIEAVLEDKESGRAGAAAAALLRLEPTTNLERFFASKHSWVRKLALDSAMRNGGAVPEATLQALLREKYDWIRLPAAQHAGAIVSKAAVPDLIALLRDGNEAVRTAASDALTRIRFFHEQQAHWDRVLKGLDASPASAAEKLLLQAKPTAPRAQRLLAITSLGALGAPEALPFLIEWTSDADAEVATAAKAAITQIHLNPRR